MSQDLYYRPISKKSISVGDFQLRNIIEKKFGYRAVISYISIPYLEALQDAGIEGADELIEAIRKHDEIEIYIE